MAIIDKPSDYFNTVLWTGNGSARSITGVGFQPDWVWGKNRGNDDNDYLMDSIRGATKRITTNNSQPEGTSTGLLTSFDSDGFSLGTSAGLNASGITAVAWNWKAGTAWSNDASATGIGTLDSSGSVNATAGFSIISFTGTETSSQSVAHGLGAVPELIISKSRDVVDNWMVYHGTYSSQQYQSLNLTTAVASSANIWTSLPTSTVINIGDNAGVNDNGAMIMYAFRSVQGYSKFGSYTGNGNADGTFVYTGFRPAFVMIKSSSLSQDWFIHDNKRSTFNVSNTVLLPNTVDLDITDTTVYGIDMVSNGFKVRGTHARINQSGSSYIYMCFAEHPFVTSTSIPTTAR
eukprot:GHVU01081208.1.p1 GENE.GHVU01081208.1~~GHVU01081208.1.p1  ORF type:complete len:347 (-),score=17.81 GHVU01081208.1:1540-2580(-)